MRELSRRKEFTTSRIAELVGLLKTAPDIAKSGDAAVCATGSIGRLDASEHSDIDLQLITRTRIEESGRNRGRSTLPLLDEIVLKADIINALKSLGLRDLDGDGRYFQRYTIASLIKAIGDSDDDASNAFTTRLLLLLECKPIIGEDVYDEAVDQILAAYWSDFEGRQASFIPAFFTNDILRLWRTFCVNYEARTKNLKDAERRKRKVKNLKLKYHRMLTCYSAVIYLLHIYASKGTVTPPDAKAMVRLSPIDRFLYVQQHPRQDGVAETIARVIESYDSFLVITNRSEDDLLHHIEEQKTFEEMRAQAHEFGDAVYAVLNLVGEGNRFHRLIIV